MLTWTKPDNTGYDMPPKVHIKLPGAFFINIRLVLMRRSEKVKNDLYRVECCERDLDEESVPVAHSSVPEAWKLEGLKLASLIALRADESCILIHILEQVEALSFVIVEAAYDVNRIEVSCRSKGIACVIV